jgi:hypothetical protein
MSVDLLLIALIDDAVAPSNEARDHYGRAARTEPGIATA